MSTALSVIETFASIGTLGLAAWSLVILKEYAADTKKIAEASVRQLEHSQTPFVTPVLNVDEGWRLENHGVGPAINGKLGFVQNGPQSVSLPNLSAGAILNCHNVLAPLVGNQGGSEIQYESLSGQKYRTVVSWTARRSYAGPTREIRTLATCRDGREARWRRAEKQIGNW